MAQPRINTGKGIRMLPGLLLFLLVAPAMFQALLELTIPKRSSSDLRTFLQLKPLTMTPRPKIRPETVSQVSVQLISMGVAAREATSKVSSITSCPPLRTECRKPQ